MSFWLVPMMLIFQSTLPARGATGVTLLPAPLVPNFNPRSPHGERPHRLSHGGEGLLISIHAPRTGSDRDSSYLRMVACYFNPRSPHGERPIVEDTARAFVEFQSTLPARGATVVT